MKRKTAAAATSRLDIHPFRDDMQINHFSLDARIGGETPLFTAALFNTSRKERNNYHE
jgi:hypothetical protein